MRRINIFLLVIFSCVGQLVAQENTFKIKAEHFSLEKGSAFEFSDAVIIDELEQVYFEYLQHEGAFVVAQEVSQLIKINTKAGAEKSRIQLYYSTSNFNKEQLDIQTVKVYSIGKSGVVEKSLDKAFIKKNSIEKDFIETTIDFSEVPIGSLVEVHYIKYISMIDKLPIWHIKGLLPKLKTRYRAVIPEYYKYLEYFTGEKIKVSKSEKAVAVKYGGTVLNESIELNYATEQVSEITGEPYVDNIMNYVPQLHLDLYSVKMPGMSQQTVALTQNEFFRNLLKDRSFYGQLKQARYLEKYIEGLEITQLTPLEKAEKIYTAIRNKVTWNGEYGVFAQEGARTVFNGKRGNGADINLLLTDAFRVAGLDAWPVVLSTISHGRQGVWNNQYFNHVISAIKIDSNYYIVDASDKQATFNLLPINDLNGEGVIINDKGNHLEISLTPKRVSDYGEGYQLEIDALGNVKGYGTLFYKGSKALEERDKLGALGDWRYGKAIEIAHPGWMVRDIKVIDDTTSNSDLLRFRFAMTQKNSGYGFGNKLFINPFQFFSVYLSPFTESKREYPVNFIYPTLGKFNLLLFIPEGYKVHEVPKDKQIESLGLGLKAEIQVKEVLNKVEVHLSLEQTKTFIAVKDYSALFTFYKQLETAMKELVVFEKQ